MKYVFDNTNQNRIAGIFFTQVKYIPEEIKETLIRQQIYEDLQQELYAEICRYSCDVDRNRKYLRRRAQKTIYTFLKNYGFRKDRDYKGFWINPVTKIQNKLNKEALYV